ncbi:hypothetical protein [Pluralibacter sp.]|uniref:hypothetical protein n=1 Tax=Pluralibacter sp. TaxID=1920032 RepID=UPI0025D0487E|nr:hypothetical protein [Pluralibacter sp.]MBV8042317.1 hypothetical protein [Pluralibacter sp.]
MKDDELEHLRANYWGTTFLCGAFLGIFLFMLRQQQSGLMLFCMGALALLCAFFSLRLSRQLRKLKREQRNVNVR